MGLNFKYNIIIKKENQNKVLNFINLHGAIHKTDYGDCAIIDFEPDTFILNYLKAERRRNNSFSLTKIFKRKKLENQSESGVGYIYLGLDELMCKEEMCISFIASTTRMSYLFESSGSIKKWFIELSKEAMAILTFLYLEEDGYRLIYHESEPINIEIKNDITFEYDKEQFLEIMKTFSNRIEWHNES